MATGSLGMQAYIAEDFSIGVRDAVVVALRWVSAIPGCAGR